MGANIGYVEKVTSSNELWASNTSSTQNLIMRLNAITGQTLGLINIGNTVQGNIVGMCYSSAKNSMYVLIIKNVGGSHELRILKVSTTTFGIESDILLITYPTSVPIVNNVVLNITTGVMFICSLHGLIKYNTNNDSVDSYSPGIGSYGGCFMNTVTNELWLCLPAVNKIVSINQNDGTILSTINTGAYSAANGVYCASNNTLWVVGGNGYTETSGFAICYHATSRTALVYKDGIGGMLTEVGYHSGTNKVWAYDSYKGKLMSLNPSSGVIVDNSLISPDRLLKMVIDESNSSIWYTNENVNSTKVVKKGI